MISNFFDVNITAKSVHHDVTIDRVMLRALTLAPNTLASDIRQAISPRTRCLVSLLSAHLNLRRSNYLSNLIAADGLGKEHYADQSSEFMLLLILFGAVTLHQPLIQYIIPKPPY